ncbi:MAG: cupin domain-containing protein [Luteitalea sp.]|nr:cupin domain-containing protein [Luteitalea sp.]
MTFIKRFDEGEAFECIGHAFTMLVSRDDTACCEAVLQRLPLGAHTPPNAHETFIQLLIVTEGTAAITVADETRTVAAPAIALVPRRTEHAVRNASDVEPLAYLYVSVWEEGIPPDERRSGWREVYRLIAAEYAARGYGSPSGASS